jgi:TRAP-type transport system periplasmic protein
VQPVALRFGGYQPARSVHTRTVRAFEAGLERRLGDGVAFSFLEDVTQTGRRAADLLAMTEAGELDLCYFSSSYLAGRVPALALFDLPFVIDDRQTAYRLLDGEAGARLADEVAEKTGFEVLSMWDNGIRHISNSRRPIRHPDDCRGLRIRTLDNDLHQRAFRAMGFEPVAIDVKDLAAAVAEGRVDAQENPLTNTVNFGLHRHHPYLSLTGHMFGAALVLANRRALESWPAEVREAVIAAMEEATAAQRRFATSEDAVCLEELRAAGVSVCGDDELDRPAFREAVAEIVAEEHCRMELDALSAAPAAVVSGDG